jgi:hypothetical protein
MLMRLLFVSILLLACSGVSTPEPAQAPAQQAPAVDLAGAEAVVKELYAPYLSGQGGPDLLKAGKLSGSLQALWDADQKKSEASGEMGAVTFDVMTNAQDNKLSELVISSAPAGPGATVTARFKNYDQAVTVGWDMVQERGAWKVDNIRPEGQVLRRILQGK